jgi:hypothetical protein
MFYCRQATSAYVADLWICETIALRLSFLRSALVPACTARKREKTANRIILIMRLVVLCSYIKFSYNGFNLTSTASIFR